MITSLEEASSSKCHNIRRCKNVRRDIREVAESTMFQAWFNDFWKYRQNGGWFRGTPVNAAQFRECYTENPVFML